MQQSLEHKETLLQKICRCAVAQDSTGIAEIKRFNGDNLGLYDDLQPLIALIESSDFAALLFIRRAYPKPFVEQVQKLICTNANTQGLIRMLETVGPTSLISFESLRHLHTLSLDSYLSCRHRLGERFYTALPEAVTSPYEPIYLAVAGLIEQHAMAFEPACMIAASTEIIGELHAAVSAGDKGRYDALALTDELKIAISQLLGFSNTLLREAIKHKNTELVVALLKDFKIDVLTRAPGASADLCDLIDLADLSLIQFLLESQPEALRRVVTFDGKTSIEYAATKFGEQAHFVKALQALERQQIATELAVSFREPLGTEAASLDPSVLTTSSRLKELIGQYQIDAKYLGGMRMLPKQQKPGAAQATTGLFKQYDLQALKTVSQIPYQVLQTETDWFRADYYCASEQSFPEQTERLTYVLAGRGANAMVPSEDLGGRVILVVGPQQAEEARQWVGPQRDVLVIKSLSIEVPGDAKKELVTEQLGTVTARRIVAFLFSLERNMKSPFIMLDDNINHVYLLPSEHDGTWKSVYQTLQKEAQATESHCLSLRTERNTFSHIGAQQGEQAKPKIGSKLFFIDFLSVSRKCTTSSLLTRLFPSSMLLWGEDIFFQIMLHLYDLNVKVLDAQLAYIIRSRTHRNLCVKEGVQPASEWLTLEADQFHMGWQQSTFLSIRAMVENSQQRYARYIDKLSKADLGQSHAQNNQAIIGAPIECVESLTGDINNFQSVARHLITHKGTLLSQMQTRQVQAIEALSAMRNTAVVDMATGTGKTMIFSALAAAMIRSQAHRDKNVIIVEPYRNLVQQVFINFYQKYNQLFLSLGVMPEDVIKVSSNMSDIDAHMIAINEKLKILGGILIFCAKSLRNLLDTQPKFFDNVSLIIIDEVHHQNITDDLLTDIKGHCEKSETAGIAFSATPGEKGLCFGGAPAYSYDIPAALSDQVLCPWFIESLGLDYTVNTAKEFIPKAAQFLQARIHPMGGRYSERYGLIFVTNGDLAQDLSGKLNGAGIPAGIINSRQSKQQNDRTLKAFNDRTGEIRVIIAVQMLKLGVDFNVDYEIFLQKGSNEDEMTQAIGRVIRLNGIQASEPKIASMLVFNDANIGLPSFSGFPDSAMSFHPDFSSAENALIEGYALTAYVAPTPASPETRSPSPASSSSSLSDDELLLYPGFFRPTSAAASSAAAADVQMQPSFFG